MALPYHNLTVYNIYISLGLGSAATSLQTCIALGSMARKRLFAQARCSRIKEVSINLSKTLRGREREADRERERE